MVERNIPIESPEVVNPPPTFGGVGEFKFLSPLERVASTLALLLFALITAVLATIVIDWLVHRPSTPDLAQLKLEDQKLAIDNYKVISEVAWDRTSRVFDLVIVKALLPIFATIVGYLLGKRGN
jgi:hypothetical protein